MTPKHEKYIVYGTLAAGAAVMFYLLFHKHNVIVNDAQNGYPFTGGFPFVPAIQWGPSAQPIASVSQINNAYSVTANPNLLGLLSQNYMPLFGFIGQAALS
jgi:hypothetical protein